MNNEFCSFITKKQYFRRGKPNFGLTPHETKKISKSNSETEEASMMELFFKNNERLKSIIDIWQGHKLNFKKLVILSV